MSDDLAEVYNYVSDTVRDPSRINLLYRTSAQNKQVEEQFMREKKLLEDIQKFVEDNFEKAEQYLRAIQLGGYATFFGLWSITKDSLHSTSGLIAAALMLISVITFVIWEISKATILSFALKDYAHISGSTIEEAIKKRVTTITRQESAINALTKSRATFWIISIASALLGGSVLLAQLVFSISKGIFG